MAESAAPVAVTYLDIDEGWEQDEETGGLVRMVRESDALAVGLWKPNGVAGARIEYQLDADETLVVLQGSGEVRVDGGEPIELRLGRRSGMFPDAAPERQRRSVVVVAAERVEE